MFTEPNFSVAQVFICSVLSPQVVWRYSGKTPETLAPNTKLYDWIPQNDLLGKESVVLVTHKEQ